MSFAELLGTFVLGAFVGGVGGTLLGFVWYEHKTGLLSDSSGKRAAAIRSELDDVFESVLFDEVNGYGVTQAVSTTRFLIPLGKAGPNA